MRNISRQLESKLKCWPVKYNHLVVYTMRGDAPAIAYRNTFSTP